MRNKRILTLAAVALMVILQGCHPEQASNSMLGGAASANVEHDAELEVVRKFYRYLIQETPPTLEEALEVFENLLRQDFPREGQDAQGAVAFNYLRSHRHWFLPFQAADQPWIPLQDQEELLTSTRLSPIQLRWTAADSHRKPEVTLFILAVFHERKSDSEVRLRSVVFPFIGGRISAAAIKIGGFDGFLVQDKLLQRE